MQNLTAGFPQQQSLGQSENAYHPVKNKTRTRKQSHKRGENGNQNVGVFFRLHLWHNRLQSNANQVVEVEAEADYLNQSRCTFPGFVFGLVLPLLVATPTA